MLKEIFRSTLSDTKTILKKPIAFVFTVIYIANWYISQLKKEQPLLGVLFMFITLIITSYLTFYISKVIQTNEKKLIENETTLLKVRIGKATKYIIISFVGLAAIMMLFAMIMNLLLSFKENKVIVTIIYILYPTIIVSYLCRISIIIPISVLSEEKASLKESIRITRGHIWKIIALQILPLMVLIIDLIILVSVLARGIELTGAIIISLPLGTIGMMLYTILPINIYYHLKNNSDIALPITESVE